MSELFSLESLIENNENRLSLNDYGRDHGMYGMEASDALGESEILFVSLESFQQSIDFTNSIVRNSFESLDDYDIRKDNKYTEKLASMESKIGDTIKKIIEKLIEAVKKFMRQIQAFISGPIMRGQAKFISKNRQDIMAVIDSSATMTTKIYPWKQNITTSMFGSLFDSIADKQKFENDLSFKSSEQDFVEAYVNTSVFGEQSKPESEERDAKNIFNSALLIVKSLEDADAAKSALKSNQKILSDLKKESKKNSDKDSKKEDIKIIKYQVKASFYLFSIYMKYRSDLMKICKLALGSKKSKS